MRRALFVFGLMAVGAASQAVVIANWGFEINTPADFTGAVYGGWLPDAGAGTGFGRHASAATAWSTPAGNGSANSISSTNWAVGDYYQWDFATTGLMNITLDFDAASSNTGPRDFVVQWSANGSGYTNFAPYTVLANASPNPVWNATTGSPIYHHSFNLSSVTALNNVATASIRLTQLTTVSANGGTVAAGGTSRRDNILIQGSPVPEPGTMIALAMGGAALLARRRARK